MGWKIIKRHLILDVELSEWTVTPFQNAWTLSASSKRLLAWELEVGEGGEEEEEEEEEEEVTGGAVEPVDGSLPHNPPPREITTD